MVYSQKFRLTPDLNQASKVNVGLGQDSRNETRLQLWSERQPDMKVNDSIISLLLLNAYESLEWEIALINEFQVIRRKK